MVVKKMIKTIRVMLIPNNNRIQNFFDMPILPDSRITGR